MKYILPALTFAAAAAVFVPDARADTTPISGLYTSNNYIVSAVGPYCQGLPGFPPLPSANTTSVSHIKMMPPYVPGSVEYFDFVDTLTPDPTQNNSVILKLSYPASAPPGAKTWSGVGTATIYAPGPAFNFPPGGVSVPFRFTVNFSYNDRYSFSATDVTTIYSDQNALNANQPLCTLSARATHVYTGGLF
jgi:hypothetical protein